MDAAVVGGHFLSAFLEFFFAKIATPAFLGCLGIAKLKAEDFTKMKMMFSSANLVLNDAEQQQITNPIARKWLDDLQEVIYDTRDLLDRIEAANIFGRIEAANIFGNVGLNEEMTEILIKLENIVHQKNHLGLKSGVQNTILPRPQTTSLVEDSGVYGRDADKEAIMELLLSNEMNGNKISVIPIVGMSGIGKTALAQLIYNEIDNKVMEKPFDFKAWVCVTNEFSIFKITKTIAKRVITSVKFEDDGDLDFIQVELKKALTNKKFLIVLDDVWVEEYSLWNAFMKPFSHGEYGSKIIVTTQSGKIASMVHDLPPYRLTTLSSDACWNLFKKVAFNNSNPIVPSELEEIGREIVEKCNGLPLAVKSLGSLLRHQSNSKDWESIRDSDIWELSQKDCNILHALWLSYQHLPSHLKQCFAYCSIFPKGFQFDKEDLIKLWMAEDLLHPQKSKRIEDVGEEYVHDLLSRSLFKKSTKLDKSVCFTMHDLVNDLATFIVGDLCLRSDCSSLNKASNKKIRYWSHLTGGNDNFEKFEGLVEAKHLRTLLLTSTRHLTAKLELANLLPLLTCLRVLSLYNTSITELPNSIADLKLLRYLNLSRTRIKKIPNGVCTLYNLQTLLLRNCSELFLLPPEMINLTNLRHLDIECTSIKEMPKGMGTLKDLQTLSSFVLGEDNTIEELKNLQDLGGSLHILQLENLVKAEEVTAARLKDMKYLTELEFEWSLKSDGGSQNQNPQEVLARLQPHTNIKVIKIKMWRGKKFPNWVGDHSFSNLEHIELLGCMNCDSLPPLGQLPFLKKLVICQFTELLKIGDELYGGSAEDTPFRCLELLQISQMPKCKEWSFSGGDFKGSFPKLKELVLKASPDLTAELCLPETVETIEISGCHKIDLNLSESNRYKSLTKLHGCISIKSIFLDCFPKLSELHLDCKNLESLEQSRTQLSFLRCLKLTKCPNFKRFPQGGLSAPNLKEFHICSCKELSSLPLPSSLQTLFISECPKLESFSEQRLPSNLKQLSICDCNKLFESRLNWNLQGLTSLSTLYISNIDKGLHSFPEDQLLPITLTSLSIVRFTKLGELNGNALQQLTSLERLTVSHCGEIKSLPVRLPDSVQILDITGSKRLEDLYSDETGDDWDKVSHIRQIITTKKPESQQ